MVAQRLSACKSDQRFIPPAYFAVDPVANDYDVECVLAEHTQTFNENDITYFCPSYRISA